MPDFYGKHYSPDDLRKLVGNMAQLAGVRPVELSDGKARGMRTAEVYTGSGLRFQVLIDRAMDIGYAEFRVSRSPGFILPWAGRTSTSLKDTAGRARGGAGWSPPQGSLSSAIRKRTRANNWACTGVSLTSTRAK